MNSNEFRLFLEHTDPKHPDVPWQALVMAKHCFIESLTSLWMQEERSDMLIHYVDQHTNVTLEFIREMQKNAVRHPKILDVVAHVAQKHTKYTNMSRGTMLMPILDGFLYCVINGNNEDVISKGKEGVQAFLTHPVLRDVLDNERFDLFSDCSDNDYLVDIFYRSVLADNGVDRPQEFYGALRMFPDDLQQLVVESLVKQHLGAQHVDKLFLNTVGTSDQIRDWVVGCVERNFYVLELHQKAHSEVFQMICAKTLRQEMEHEVAWAEEEPKATTRRL